MKKLCNCLVLILFSIGLSTITACKSVYDFVISNEIIEILQNNPNIKDIGIGKWTVSSNIIDLDLATEQVDSIDIEYNNSNINIFSAHFKNKEEFPFLEIFTEEAIYIVSEQELPYLKFCEKISINKGKDYIMKRIEELENYNEVYISKEDHPLKWYLYGKYRISPICLKLFKRI